jgi:hypothetical protein
MNSHSPEPKSLRETLDSPLFEATASLRVGREVARSRRALTPAQKAELIRRVNRLRRSVGR